MRRGSHQQVVVGHRGERLAELVGEGLVVRTGRTHFVGLVHDDQVPVAAEQTVRGVRDARDPRYRRDDLVLLLPGVHPVVGPEHVTPDDLECFPELILQFALPLEGQVRRRDDQRAFGQPADLEFLEEQASHDGLACAGVVRLAGSESEAA